MRLAVLGACALISCGGPEARTPVVPAPQPAPEPEVRQATAADLGLDQLAYTEVEIDPAASFGGEPETWLKGSTHVHARPSGDSVTPIPDVIRWYETNGYDFIVLTDHNKVTDAAQAPEQGLIVIPGIELTHNPDGCLPKRDPSDKCRIHVNLLGVMARPEGKVEWADRKTRDRQAKYEAALVQQRALGGIAQINHPSWFWGMTGELLTTLAKAGFVLVEIENAQFAAWNKGDADHPSTEALWDAALTAGATVWGVASDDAHDYTGKPGVKYPAGGAWVVVRAARRPDEILRSLALGRFYSSTGVALSRAEVDGNELVIEVDPSERGTHTIEWIENAARTTVTGRTARRTLPAQGYLRAVVTRDDGKRAWVQPARR